MRMIHICTYVDLFLHRYVIDFGANNQNVHSLKFVISKFDFFYKHTLKGVSGKIQEGPKRVPNDIYLYGDELLRFFLSKSTGQKLVGFKLLFL
jgi:hypothetical protein